MNRRNLLMSLAIAPGWLEQEPAGTPDPSLYIPKAHLVEDRTFLHDFMDEFSFVDLITPSPTLRITHIPVFLDRSQGPYGTIFGHISAQNPQNKTFDGSHDAAIVFRGPHGYISPKWYTKQDVVPTWNFAVVHALGRPKAVRDKAPFHSLLSRLIRKFEERAGTGYDFTSLPDAYVSNMMQGIVGFEMEVRALEGKFKLGQERNASDRQGILGHLRAAKGERSLHDLTDAFYKRT